jgi:multidrug resistance efflux pump
MDEHHTTNHNNIKHSEQEEHKSNPKRRRLNIILNTISVLLALSGIVWASHYFYKYYQYEITNDASIDQYIMPVNTRVSGYIKKVYFTEHQFVYAGDTLLVIDDSEYRIKLMEAEAALLDAKANILHSQASLEMAKLYLSYTVITAPYDGYAGRRTLEAGQLVQAGQAITNLIKDDQKWVTANYREMQIENIYIGQKVRIKVDAVSKKTFYGSLTAISGATGAKFSMLPTDNSAGNFVKIQQRIPVRIDFENISDEDMRKLRVGMMVTTEAIKR